MHDVKQRSIVFINEHDNLLLRFLINTANQICETDIRIFSFKVNSILLFIAFQHEKKETLQLFRIHMLAQTHIKIQHRIFIPFLLQALNGKSFKQILFSFKITLHR